MRHMQSLAGRPLRLHTQPLSGGRNQHAVAAVAQPLETIAQAAAVMLCMLSPLPHRVQGAIDLVKEEEGRGEGGLRRWPCVRACMSNSLSSYELQATWRQRGRSANMAPSQAFRENCLPLPTSVKNLPAAQSTVPGWPEPAARRTGCQRGASGCCQACRGARL